MLRRFRKMIDGLKAEEGRIWIETGEFHGVPLVAVAGDIDHNNAGELRVVVEDLLREGHRRLILDLEGVTYLDSGGMSLLFDIVRTVRDGGWVGVVRPGGNIRRLLEITGLSEQEGFKMFPSEDEARSAIGAP